MTDVLDTTKKPIQARAKARREKIIACTEMIVRRDGIDAVSTTSIAQEASIPVGSIYRYFKDKNDILVLLHHVAFDEVTGAVAETLETLTPGQGFRKTHEALFRVFWKAAREHPTFRALTRWENAHASLWEVTPGPNSRLDDLVRKSLDVAGTELPPKRRGAMLRTAVTALSVLIDQAIEEDDEATADALINEITTLLTNYFE